MFLKNVYSINKKSGPIFISPEVGHALIVCLKVIELSFYNLNRLIFYLKEIDTAF